MAFDKARAAQDCWSKKPISERAHVVAHFVEKLAGDSELLKTLTEETGKPYFEAACIELLYSAELARFYTSRTGRSALRDQRRAHGFFRQKLSQVRRLPYGVVGVIAPFNWPLLCGFADAIAPLMAGNAVVLKPSPLTPLTSVHIGKLWRSFHADGGTSELTELLQVVPGGAEAGQAVVDHADMVFFTGGAQAGRRVAARAGHRLIPCVLELGGKNPMLVTRDAPMDAAVQAALWGGFIRSGEACVSVERIFVETAVADAFVSRLAERASRLRVGPPGLGPGDDPDLGPLTMPGKKESLTELVMEALDQGAQVVSGGWPPFAKPPPGNAPAAEAPVPSGVQDTPTYLPPTVIDHVTPDMRIAREEFFGPILPIIRAENLDEAVTASNALGVGLSASVIAGSRQRALAFAKRLKSGNICLNDALIHYFCVEAPLAGMGASGLGQRHGREGLLQFTQPQTIVYDRPLLSPVAATVKRILPFPHRAWVARILGFILKAFYRRLLRRR